MRAVFCLLLFLDLVWGLGPQSLFTHHSISKGMLGLFDLGLFDVIPHITETCLSFLLDAACVRYVASRHIVVGHCITDVLAGINARLCNGRCNQHVLEEIDR